MGCCVCGDLATAAQHLVLGDVDYSVQEQLQYDSYHRFVPTARNIHLMFSNG